MDGCIKTRDRNDSAAGLRPAMRHDDVGQDSTGPCVCKKIGPMAIRDAADAVRTEPLPLVATIHIPRVTLFDRRRACRHPYNAANYSTDRFTVTLQELPQNLGHDCNFNFRIVSLRQITESRFPLPPVPVPAAPINGSAVSFGIVSSSIDPAVIADPVKAVLPLAPCT